jgi:gas vesicle protein
MKVKREMLLSEALDEIADRVQRLKSEGAARVNGYEIKLDDTVMLEIESEAEKGKAELEFEIKWEAGKKRGRPGRRLLLGAAAGAAVGAAALTALRRRRQGSGEEEYDL